MKRATVVGGGISGLSAGYFLSKNGYNVTIYEKGPQLGGLGSGWKRKGYSFDLCMHWFCGINSQSKYYDLWNELGLFKNVIGTEFDIIKKIEYKKDCYINFYSDLNKFRAELIKVLPEDKALINDIIDDLNVISQNTLDRCLINYIETTDKFKLLLQNKAAVKTLSKWSSKDIRQLSEMFHNTQTAYNILRALMFCGDIVNVGYIFGALSQLSSGGIGVLNGTTGALIRALEKSCRDAGCDIYINSSVDQVIVKDNRVTRIKVNDKEVKDVDYLIGTCDFKEFFKNILNISDAVISPFEKKEIFGSVLQVSLGIDEEIDDISQTILLDNPMQIDSRTTIDFLDVRILNSNKCVAASGKTVVEITVYADYQSWYYVYCADKKQYEVMKNKIAEKLINIVDSKVKIKSKIEVIDVLTPVTIARYTQNRNGCILGWNEDVDISKVISAMPNNCFYIGQWSQRGMNMSSSALSGKLIADMIIDKDKK